MSKRTVLPIVFLSLTTVALFSGQACEQNNFELVQYASTAGESTDSPTSPYPLIDAQATKLPFKISGLEMYHPPRAGAQVEATSAWNMWCNCFASFPVHFPVAGVYDFAVTVEATKPGANLEIFIDAIIKDHVTVDTTQQKTFHLRAFASPYPQTVGLRLTNHEEIDVNVIVHDLSVTLVTQAPQNISGTRDPRRQPYSEYSLWNTAIGSGAIWSSPQDADTKDLRTLGGAINAEWWTPWIFQASAADPIGTLTVRDDAYPLPDQTIQIPREAQASPDSDANLAIISPDGHFYYNHFGCQRDAAGTGFSCFAGEKNDVCTDGYNAGADYTSNGEMRKWELEAGVIKHMLSFALPTKLTRSGDTWVTGIAWPATREDFCGPGCYKGNVLFGSTIGIPSSVDIESLGLSRGGKILARALQDYGALMRATGGDNGIIFYSEQSTKDMNEIQEMRNDIDKIIPHLAVLRNQSPTTPNGGGDRRQPLLPPVDKKICPYQYIPEPYRGL